MLPDDQQKALDQFYKAAHRNTVLEPKTTLMLHLATAMAIGCYP